MHLRDVIPHSHICGFSVMRLDRLDNLCVLGVVEGQSPRYFQLRFVIGRRLDQNLLDDIRKHVVMHAFKHHRLQLAIQRSDFIRRIVADVLFYDRDTLLVKLDKLFAFDVKTLLKCLEAAGSRKL